MSLVWRPVQIKANSKLDQVSQGCVQLKSEYFPHWSLRSLSGPSHTLGKNIFPYVQSGFPFAAACAHCLSLPDMPAHHRVVSLSARRYCCSSVSSSLDRLNTQSHEAISRLPWPAHAPAAFGTRNSKGVLVSSELSIETRLPSCSSHQARMTCPEQSPENSFRVLKPPDSFIVANFPLLSLPSRHLPDLPCPRTKAECHLCH